MDPQKAAALKALAGLRDGSGRASMSHLMPEDERSKHSITIVFGEDGTPSIQQEDPMMGEEYQEPMQGQDPMMGQEGLELEEDPNMVPPKGRFGGNY